MFKVFLFSLVVWLCSGCASSSSSRSSFVQHVTVQKTAISKMDRRYKYAESMGCKMLKSGYMICPKSINHR